MASKEITVNVPQDLDPVYSNMIQIAFRDDEFTFLFLHQIPNINQAKAKSIVTISPKHAKKFLTVLQQSVAEFESKFGTIEPPKEQQAGESVTMRGYS
ncbi:MAG: hypothetical protein XE11_0402 [Methanomicrobiales archaeon 53_19]|jgi:hypothetical protein|uniref:DUF3467 domain-containing protein n=1 Tax=Methanocalculus sp. TaxID=2004547 RepID=UPI000746C2ED|nr:DUF3467 domain-containing protein [Methanocalculus sp.]KUK68384.1 MAG: hypothetical protein XD88_1934 [Methanocalculus sp. 52_23]KUL04622.1 MAG: hypothetical protein XE11_0402 [Methanomicrobiales archaeon 53_19]HIJ06843.1 DUF3467 domain-containing protein [Methanocalculus sp.]